MSEPKYNLKKIVGCILALLFFPFLLTGQEDLSKQRGLISEQAANMEGLKILQAQVESDLLKINIPSSTWVSHSEKTDDPEILDVAIIGGGMSGMTVCFALIKEGISNIKMFDENLPDQEGPWIKSARMNILRSGKRYQGPALGVPSLTFHSWYEAQYGKDGWENLQVCPTKLWHDYLCWFRRVLKLPIENRMVLINLEPMENVLRLTFSHEGYFVTVYARKVVLATGREGSGGKRFPQYLNGISKRLYAHTAEIIDPELFRNKRIAIIGGGSSAFDVAGVALENDAVSVEMIVRRPAISQVNKFAQFAYPGLENGFYFLSDEMRCLFFAEVLKDGAIDPSQAAVERIKDFKNLHIHYSTYVKQIVDNGEEAVLKTNTKELVADFIVFATGYEIDLSKRSELDSIRPGILLWEKRVPKDFLEQVPMLGRFPYLGRNFEFMESEPGGAPFLKNIHCFNFGAFLSHSLLSGEIPGISSGATRLAKGIAADFFLNESMLYFDKIRDWQTPDFISSDYPPLNSN